MKCRNWPVPVLISLAACCRAPQPVLADDTGMRLQQESAVFKVLVGERSLMEYRFAPTPKKPYVVRLTTPSGVNVLRDSPEDHQHHHALMFAVGVDGVDFWSENDACGRQENREIDGQQRRWSLASEAQPVQSAELAGVSQRIEWVGPQSDKLLLTERRSVLAGQSPDGKATLLLWQTRLAPPKGTERAVLDGSHYFGLGMRFVRSMDQGGAFFNADGNEGEAVRGTERLTAVKWMAYTANTDGKPVTAALFDHPSNPRHPARMFTMTAPFAYLSATLNLFREPLEIRAGKPLELHYAAAIWDGRIDAAAVESLYRQWAASVPPSARLQ